MYNGGVFNTEKKSVAHAAWPSKNNLKYNELCHRENIQSENTESIMMQQRDKRMGNVAQNNLENKNTSHTKPLVAQ